MVRLSLQKYYENILVTSAHKQALNQWLHPSTVSLPSSYINISLMDKPGFVYLSEIKDQLLQELLWISSDKPEVVIISTYVPHLNGKPWQVQHQKLRGSGLWQRQFVTGSWIFQHDCGQDHFLESNKRTGLKLIHSQMKCSVYFLTLDW